MASTSSTSSTPSSSATTTPGFDKDSEEGKKLVLELAEASGKAMKRVALNSDPKESQSVFAKKMLAAAMRASAIAYCDNITRREEEEKAKKTTTVVMSPELQAKVDEMIRTTVLHDYVYPPEPSPDAILIPIGGLEKCRCSPDCTETLMQPAYRVIEGAEKELWVPEEEKTVVVINEFIGKKKKRRNIVRS